MPYSAEISRENPTVILFLIDRSWSMDDPIGGDTERNQKKSEFVADAINRLLQTLVLSCARTEGVRDYFHVGVIGYGHSVSPALGGKLAGRKLVPLSQIADNPIRVEERTKREPDGAGGILEKNIKFPIWFEPVADGLTPMCGALEAAWHTVNDFIKQFPSCFPPLVMNISDGESNDDGDPEESANMLRQLASDDGRVLLFNLHVSSEKAPAIEFPDEIDAVPDDWARMLFRMSSKLPPRIMATAKSEGYAVTEAARGFTFNADAVSLIRFLDIGTRVDSKNFRE